MRAPGSSPHRRSWVLGLVFLLLAALAVACDPTGVSPEGRITASGFIEGQEVAVAAEIQGLVGEILVERGDRVEKGEVVLRLDDTTLERQRTEAGAALSVARANLDRVSAGPRAEEVAAAEAVLEEAEAQRAGAKQAVLNAEDVISNPRELRAEIDEARAQVQLAEQNVELREADLEATRVKHSVYAEQGGDTAQIWAHQLEAAQARLREAEAQWSGARAYLSGLLSILEEPLTLQADLHQAQTQVDLAESAVQRAQARLDELRAGPTEEELALAEAEVRQAQSGVDLADARLDQLVLTAPMDGIITSRAVQVGETATAGRPLLTIANLDHVTLVLYISVSQIGHVEIGQSVQVTVDSFPDRTFVGRVESIAAEAEFSPSYVQTEEDRVDLVFAVDVLIPNPDHALKPGMPADAVIHPNAPFQGE